MLNSNWKKLTYDEQMLMANAANRLIGFYMVKDIIETFDKVNLPLLFNQPGFYDRFCPDTEGFREQIEDYCFEKM